MIEPALLPSVRRAELQAFGALALANVLWGSSFLFGKMALTELPASYLVLFRFALGFLLLLPLVFRQWGLIRRADLPLILLSGFLMGPVMMLLQFEGLDRTSATSAALIIATIPVLLALAAVVVDRERLSVPGWIAVFLSMAGAVLLVGEPGTGRSLSGDLLVFASALAAVAWVLVTRRLLRRYPPLLTTALCIGVGTLALVPFAISLNGVPDFNLQPVTWGAVLALGILCTALTYSLWNWGLQRIPASRAAPFGSIEPLIGAILGIAVLHEALSPPMLLGGTLVLGAALLASFSS